MKLESQNHENRDYNDGFQGWRNAELLFNRYSFIFQDENNYGDGFGWSHNNENVLNATEVYT